MSGLLDELIHALSDPAVYPHGPDRVHVVQTHISVVFIAGDLVYKIKKPVQFGFLDFTTPEKRRHFCRQEVALNSRFSHGIYLGVACIYEGDSGINLAGDGQEIEAAVLMRRVPDDSILSHLLEQDMVSEEILDRLADAIAAFHDRADASASISSYGTPEVIYYNLTENFGQTGPFIGRTIDPRTHALVSDLAYHFLGSHEDLLRDRVRRGFIRDCHGDLHVDHVVVLDSIMLMDCIEFNDRFRYCDTAADLAFLLMDLDFQGYPAFAHRIAQRYALSSRDEQILELLGFYKSYRAFVRGKVIGFTLDEEEVSNEDKNLAAQTAGEYFRLSLALLLPPPPPALIVTMGLTGTGKSFLAAKLGKRIGIEPMRSDLLRKDIMGVASSEHRLDKYGEGIYTPRATELTYGALLDTAGKALRRGETVILDASFARLEDRMRARDLAAETGARFNIIQCTAPGDVVRRRLQERISRKDEPSDGRWEIYLEQQRRFDPLAPQEQELARTWDSAGDVNQFLAHFVRGLLEGE